MSELTPMTPAASASQDSDTDPRGRPLSDFAKRCEHCGKRTHMAIIEGTTFVPNRLQRFLLKIFAPDGVELYRTYECPRCGHQFHDLSFTEAVLAPLMMITAMALVLIAFLLFVFFVARD